MSERKQVWGARFVLSLLYGALLFGLISLTTRDPWSVWPVTSRHLIFPILMIPAWGIIVICAIVICGVLGFEVGYGLYHLHLLALRKPLKRPWSWRWRAGEGDDPAKHGWKPGKVLRPGTDSWVHPKVLERERLL